MDKDRALSTQRRVTVNSLRDMAAAESPQRIVMITAYDNASARLVDRAGVDVVLVGDSLGMTMLGYDSTLPVTMDDMVRATAAVSRGCERALVVADMPFGSYQASVDEAVRNASRLLAEGGAHAVKLEGSGAHVLDVVERLVESGIPVMGHLGLTPQSVNAFGGYRTQAKDAMGAADLLEACLVLEALGAFAIVLECVPEELAARAAQLAEIPMIGIGAGIGCDGEVQVFHDILGLTEFLPRHAKRYADLSSAIVNAVGQYAEDVRERSFPGVGQSVSMDPDTLAEAERIFAADEGDE